MTARSEGASSGTLELGVVTAPALEEMARCGEVRRPPAARRGCCRFAFRRTAGVLGGFEPKRRMGEGENGGRLSVWKRKKGCLAAGKARGRWRRAVLGGHEAGGGGFGRGKIGEEEKPQTGGDWLMCWRFKPDQTDPKQFK
jgi:hypothetical protein